MSDKADDTRSFENPSVLDYLVQLASPEQHIESRGAARLFSGILFGQSNTAYIAMIVKPMFR